MKLVFFDTDVISNWHGDNPKFRVTFPLALNELESGSEIAKLFTVVNYQELLVWGIKNGKRAGIEAFLRENFSPPVAMDEVAVRRSARIYEDLPSVFPVKTKEISGSDFRKEKDVWFRDVSILGIAAAKGAHAVVTCSRDFKKFEPVIAPTRIIVVEELASSISVGEA